jgi:RNA polymerase sigma-70 factor (ECF subfamily)
MSDDLEMLFRQSYPAVVRYLHRKVWDLDRAEDLAQEVFVRLLCHAPENPRAWLFTVAANLARDEARTAIRRRRHLVLLKDDPNARPSRPAAPDDGVVLDEQDAEVRRALEQLTPRDREVLLLWDAGLAYDEIASQTGLALGAIGTTLARARKRLVAAHERLTAGRRMDTSARPAHLHFSVAHT